MSGNQGVKDGRLPFRHRRHSGFAPSPLQGLGHSASVNYRKDALMPRSMFHPDYVYTPWSQERRERASAASRRRLGIPDGCARLYGLHIPIKFAATVRDDAAWIANNVGWPEAQRFIGKVMEIDWSLVDELYEEHVGYRELAEVCGVPDWYIEKRTQHLRRINPWRIEKKRRDC